MFSRIQVSSGEYVAINGQKGKYTGKIDNASVCYGRNAANNYMNYLAQYTPKNEIKMPQLIDLNGLSNDKFEAQVAKLDSWADELKQEFDSLPPLNYEYRYSPAKNGVDTMALLGASYEEIGGTSITVDELDEKMGIAKDGLQFCLEELSNKKTNLSNIALSSKAADLNNDNKIDIAEYAATMLLADALSGDKEKANGVITNEGTNKLLGYCNTKNYDIATKQYQSLYESYNLGAAQKEFLANPNNL